MKLAKRESRGGREAVHLLEETTWIEETEENRDELRAWVMDAGEGEIRFIPGQVMASRRSYGLNPPPETLSCPGYTSNDVAHECGLPLSHVGGEWYRCRTCDQDVNESEAR